MTCEEVMTKTPSYCIPTDSVSRAAKVMNIEGVGSVLVCESRHNRQLVGIVTDRDLALHVMAEGRDANITQVQDIMTREPFNCHAEDDLQNALDAMQYLQVRRIPIVDRRGQLIGIIAQADIATRGVKAKKTAETVEGISKPSTIRAA